MKWESFKNKFHSSWHKVIRPFIESKECDEIYKFLKAEVAGGKQIAPASSNTYRAFMMTPLDELKCIIIGNHPYSEFKDGSPVATGLYLDCSITQKVTPQLEIFYKGIEKEFYNGLNLDYVQDDSLEYLAERGVLLLSRSLTIEKDKTIGHSKEWIPFINHIIDIAIDRNIPIIFIDEDKFKIGIDWNTENVFSLANEKIETNDQDSIMWLNIDVPF